MGKVDTLGNPEEDEASPSPFITLGTIETGTAMRGVVRAMATRASMAYVAADYAFLRYLVTARGHNLLGYTYFDPIFP